MWTSRRINCRFGMVFWAIVTISFTAKATELNAAQCLSIAVSAALQLVYITKFFMWEAGYFNSLDIAQDHAGYYFQLGLFSTPTMYTSMTCYMAQNDADLHPFWALSLFCIGLLMIWLNYDIDISAQRFGVQKELRLYGARRRLLSRLPIQLPTEPHAAVCCSHQMVGHGSTFSLRARNCGRIHMECSGRI